MDTLTDEDRVHALDFVVRVLGCPFGTAVEVLARCQGDEIWPACSDLETFEMLAWKHFGRLRLDRIGAGFEDPSWSLRVGPHPARAGRAWA